MLKKGLLFISGQVLLLFAISCLVYLHQDKVALVKLPPDTLAQWYKPINKRQVWLHNMFKLRREMQAVSHYSANNEPVLALKWANSLEQHYVKIGEMVPQWQRKLDTQVISNIKTAITTSEYNRVPTLLGQLKDNCQACHADYRSIVATQYRAPDFRQPSLARNDLFVKQMQQLNHEVNGIKIASTDGRSSVALASFKQLKSGLNEIGETCRVCHDKVLKPFPTDEIKATLVELEDALVSGTLKDQGMALGSLAVQACANCHGIHRISYDRRDSLRQHRPLSALLKH